MAPNIDALLQLSLPTTENLLCDTSASVCWRTCEHHIAELLEYL